MKIKKCKKCGKEKQIHARGFCHTCYNSWWAKKHTKRQRDYLKKYIKNNRDKANLWQNRWIKKKYGNWHNYKTYLAEKRLLKKAKDFFESEEDAKIFVYNGIELDNKLLKQG